MNKILELVKKEIDWCNGGDRGYAIKIRNFSHALVICLCDGKSFPIKAIDCETYCCVERGCYGWEVLTYTIRQPGYIIKYSGSCYEYHDFVVKKALFILANMRDGDLFL